MGEAGTRAARPGARPVAPPHAARGERGRAGMSAVATLLAEMGHTVRGHDPAATTPFVEPLRALGVDVATGADRAPLPAAVEAVVTSTATPADDPDVVAAEAAGAPVLHRSAALAAICAAAHHAGGGGYPRQDDDVRPAGHDPRGHGPQAGLGGRGRHRRAGSQRRLGRRRAAGRRGRRERRHVPGAGRPAAIVTNLEPDHLENWGGEAALRDGFERFVAALDGPAVLCPTTRRRGPDRLGRRPGDLRPSRSRGRRLPGPLMVRPPSRPGVALPVPLVHGAAPEQVGAVSVTVPGPRHPQRPQRRGRPGAGPRRWACRWPMAPRRWPASSGVARRFELRGGAAGVTVVDSYDHLPTEVAAALAGGRGPVARGWSACSSPTATAAPRRCGATSPTPSSTRTAGGHRRVPGGRGAPAGGHGQAAGRGRARRPPLGLGGLAARPRRRWCGCAAAAARRPVPDARGR